MSRRELIAWYAVYGTVAVGAGAVCWMLASQNRFFDAWAVLMMACGAIWVSASNVFYEEGPAPDNGTRIGSE